MLRGRTAIITGSTSGIGLGVARRLAAAGADIVLNGFGDAAEIEALRAEIAGTHGVRATYHGADMSKPAEIAALIDHAKNEHGRLDILVNNAGIQFVAPIEEFPPERWDAVIAINLSASFHTTRLAVPLMRAQRWGRIINIASAHGLVASVNKVAYVSAKHGLVGMTKVVALETAGSGITVNAICPGWVLTPLVQKQVDALAESKGLNDAEAREALLGEKQPSKTFVTPEQLGGLAVFLCSEDASQVTGTTHSMDGGWIAQ
ncbi:MAG: 3-hydroxybutyrate dehydrogenase [Rhodospirillaceae bacterium]|nr:3-hydroxybutyrate dehydrogenase [Rhodospirillaceae bacterium]